MAETEPVQPDRSDRDGSADVKEVVSRRVRELPPPPKAEDDAVQTKAAGGPARRGPWRPLWYRKVAPTTRLWKAFWATAGGVLLLGMLGIAAWYRTLPTENTAPSTPSSVATTRPRAARLDDDDMPATQEADVLRPGPHAASKTDMMARNGATEREERSLALSAPLPVGSPSLVLSSSTRNGRPDPSPPLATKPANRPDWLLRADTPVEGKLDSRKPGGRSEGVHYGGGTRQSEEAVERGLHWLVAHQRDDGSWRFNHITEACQHYCTDPGSEASTTAATALALLPFLGASYTHKQESEYQDVVRRGLEYLRSRAMLISYGADLRDGSMYGQGLATIALCEAYALTHDPELKEVAQNALNFSVYCQDANGGGWRYVPGSPGDTTVTGWMLMALKSGQMAKLEVPSPAIFLAEKFLNSVQNEDGSQYGYMGRKPGQTTTAIGLLCRMYTGWRRDNPGLKKGLAQLARWGPSPTNMYFNYYTTQAMFHWAGPEWDAWNRKMRDFLIGRQEQVGHASGSWHFSDRYGDKGGRLYNTALAIMVLEVYYRYMPLYSEKAFGEF